MRFQHFLTIYKKKKYLWKMLGDNFRFLKKKLFSFVLFSGKHFFTYKNTYTLSISMGRLVLHDHEKKTDQLNNYLHFCLPINFWGSIYTIYGFLASEKYTFFTCSPPNPLISHPAYTRYKQSFKL